jgi:two-component system sensor histidine kinase KdpD
MTTNLLQLGRLETPGVQIQWAPEAPEELVGVVLRACRRRHPLRVILSVVPSNLPLVRCDPVLVVQLLDNLLENALKHGDPSQPAELQVQALPQHICFSVLNRGPDIPNEVKAHLFEPFQRMSQHKPVLADWDPSSPMQRTGMGLGLAVCKAIAKAHHAKLSMQDRVGGGVQVDLALPCLEVNTNP